MPIGDRLRTLHRQKNLTQADIERKTGLFRSYTCRIERGQPSFGITGV